jgi:hypothetical protein
MKEPLERGSIQAGGKGFEPIQTDPESVILSKIKYFQDEKMHLGFR